MKLSFYAYLRIIKAAERMFWACIDLVAGHTISQRLRKLKQIPPELIPLGKAVTLTNHGSRD